MKKSVTFGEYTSKIYEHLSCDIRFMYTGNIYGAMAEQFTARAHVYKSPCFFTSTSRTGPFSVIKPGVYINICVLYKTSRCSQFCHC